MAKKLPWPLEDYGQPTRREKILTAKQMRKSKLKGVSKSVNRTQYFTYLKTNMKAMRAWYNVDYSKRGWR